MKPWESHGSLSQPSILAGGMTLVDDGIVVPFTGLYYVYGQLHFDPHSGDSGCQFRLDPGSSRQIHAYTLSKTKTGSEDHTKYTGAIRLLNQGDVIRMYVYYCTLDYSHLGETFLGAFFVSFNFLDNDGPPVANMYLSTYAFYGSTSNGKPSRYFDRNGLGIHFRLCRQFVEQLIQPWWRIQPLLRPSCSQTRALFFIWTTGIGSKIQQSGLRILVAAR